MTTLLGILLLAAGAALTFAAAIAPGPFIGILVGPILAAAGVALLEGTAARARARARRRRDRRGGYVI